jgi:hypothetical protein
VTTFSGQSQSKLTLPLAVRRLDEMTRRRAARCVKEILGFSGWPPDSP